MVSFMHPQEGAAFKGAVDVNRALVPQGLWDLQEQQGFAIHVDPLDCFPGEQVGAHLLTVFELVPEIGFKPDDLRDADEFKGSIFAFIGAQEDHTAFSVCHGAVGLLERLRQGTFAVSSASELGLEVPALTKGLQVFTANRCTPQGLIRGRHGETGPLCGRHVRWCPVPGIAPRSAPGW